MVLMQIQMQSRIQALVIAGLKVFGLKKFTLPIQTIMIFISVLVGLRREVMSIQRLERL